jgi:diketogulonate reductase-like aldo/keto reductase
MNNKPLVTKLRKKENNNFNFNWPNNDFPLANLTKVSEIKKANNNELPQATFHKIMPQICIGTVNNTYRGLDEYKEILKRAIDHGYNHIDCADAYNIPLDIMKEILHYGIDKHGRDKFWITWKSEFISKEKIEELLINLELDYFDLYLVHFDYNCTQLNRLMKLGNIKKSYGYVKNIGVSNCESIDKLLDYNNKLKETYGFGMFAIEIQARPNGYKIQNIPQNRRSILNKDFYDKCNENDINLLLFSPISAFKNMLLTLLNSNSNKKDAVARVFQNSDNIFNKIIEYYTINYIKNTRNTLIIGVSAGSGFIKSFDTIKTVLESNNRNNELKNNTTVSNLLTNIGLELM